MISGKFVILVVVLTVAGSAARVSAGLAHTGVVTALCSLTQDKELCFKVLEPIDTDDPKQLAVDSCLATEGPMKNFVNFLNGLKDKHKDLLVYVQQCEDRVNGAFEDMGTFRQEAGQDFSTFAKNYSNLKQLANSVYVSLTSCTDEVDDEKLLHDLNVGMDEVKKIASNAVDIFANLDKTLKQLGFNDQLV